MVESFFNVHSAERNVAPVGPLASAAACRGERLTFQNNVVVYPNFGFVIFAGRRVEYGGFGLAFRLSFRFIGFGRLGYRWLHGIVDNINVA